ncbi:amidase family protein [Bradyrhizobium yuanmingense]|uniref:amidase family protein n=1 Tax=Bradyrhizobium yuanmingense TaxID=108015 RepID=UPI003518A81D
MPLAAQRIASSFPSPRKFRFGQVPVGHLNSFGMPECDDLYRQACTKLSGLGGQARNIDFAPFAEAGEMLFSGPWIAERHAAISKLLNIDHGDLLDVIRNVLSGAARFSATDAFAAQHRLWKLRRQIQTLFEEIDVLVVPTAPRPFTIAEMMEDPITLNNRLGYYSYFANLVDLCAVSVPNATLGNGMPMGITLLAPAWRDHVVLDLAERWLPDAKARLFDLKEYPKAAS